MIARKWFLNCRFLKCILFAGWLLSMSVASADQATQILDLMYRPVPFDAGSGIEVVPKLLGADNEEAQFHCRWFVDGEEVEDAHDVLLPGEYFERGDMVAVEVTPEWNGREGSPVKSGAVEAGNAPPRIVSSPPQQIAPGLFSYTVEAVDADEESLEYSLSVAPSGMELDAESGLLTWFVDSWEEGVVNVTVEVEDGFGGRDQQQFSLNLTFIPEKGSENE